MYRRKDEQNEMLTVCEKLVNDIYDTYEKKELDKLGFVSKCSFACGFSTPLLVMAKNMSLWKL